MTTAFLMILGGIKERLGFDRRPAPKLLTMKVPHRQGIHKIEKNLHLLSVFTDEKFKMQTELFPDKESLDYYKQSVQEFKKNKMPVIALAPGSVWYTKRWPLEKYTELVQMLDDAGYNLIFIGAPDERNLCARIISSANVEALNLAGSMSVLESAAVLTFCDLFIGNDSGAMHIANAVHTDVIAFFGPTVTTIGYYPYQKGDIVMEVPMQCRPCGSHGGNKCPLGHHQCMIHITVQSVFAVINEKFNSYTI